MDVDQNQGTVAPVRGHEHPTIVFFRDGKEVDRMVRAENRQAFEDEAAKLLA